PAPRVCRDPGGRVVITPEPTRMLPDATSLAEALAYFDSYLALQQVKERIPGVQAAVFAGDSIALSTAHGFADLEQEIPLTEDHLFRIASISKTFTAVAVMQLVERGVLRLDDPVSNWITYLAGTPVADITIFDLLSHTSGLVGNGDDGDFFQQYIRYPD